MYDAIQQSDLVFVSNNHPKSFISICWKAHHVEHRGYYYLLSSANKRTNNTYTETSKYDCNNKLVSWASDPKRGFGWSLKVTLMSENVVGSVNHCCKV